MSEKILNLAEDDGEESVHYSTQRKLNPKFQVEIVFPAFGCCMSLAHSIEKVSVDSSFDGNIDDNNF